MKTIRLIPMLALIAGMIGAPAPAQQTGGRIVSLGGSVTEIVVALGASDRLIARDTTSTWPAEVNRLPDVGYLRALSPEGVLSLAPDLILAEADAGPETAVEVLKSAGIAYVRLPEAHDPQGVLQKVAMVADALGLQAEGAALSARLSSDMAVAEARAAAISPKKRALFVLSAAGGRIMAAGQDTGAEGILTLAGAENAAQGFTGYKPMSDEAVLAAAPDVVVMMDRGGDHSAAAEELFALPALAGSPAAASKALVKMDGLLLLGFGPRTAEAANALHDALYPAD